MFHLASLFSIVKGSSLRTPTPATITSNPSITQNKNTNTSQCRSSMHSIVRMLIYLNWQPFFILSWHPSLFSLYELSPVNAWHMILTVMPIVAFVMCDFLSRQSEIHWLNIVWNGCIIKVSSSHLGQYRSAPGYEGTNLDKKWCKY